MDYLLTYLTACVVQVRAIMSSADNVLSPFMARTSAVPAGSSICNNMSHTVMWSIGDSLLTLQVDDNGPEIFTFNGFTPCSDLNAALYLGGIKGQSSRPTSFIVNSYCIAKFSVLALSLIHI